MSVVWIGAAKYMPLKTYTRKIREVMYIEVKPKGVMDEKAYGFYHVDHASE